MLCTYYQNLISSFLSISDTSSFPELIIKSAPRCFIFSAISEELGGIFAICVILICMCMFLSFFNLAMKIKNEFYCYVAMGLGTMYATQVLLTIGGVTKFIPLTGVTLPLVSYGGSSVLVSLMLIGLLQWVCVYCEQQNQEETEQYQEVQIGGGWDE